jgi:hypothetical protein
MRSNFYVRTLAFSGLVALATGANAELASTFDAGLEGWTGAGGTVLFVPAGGNPGGFLQQTDTQSSYMVVNAPAMFLGDLSAYLNGTLSFDAKNISNSASDLKPPGPWFGTVTMTGASGSVSATLAGTVAGNPPPDGQWHTYSAVLDTASWGASLGTVLANVTCIEVALEFNNVIVETAGFDNFRVSAVPEPSTAAFLTLGLGVLLFARNRGA